MSASMSMSSSRRSSFVRSSSSSSRSRRRGLSRSSTSSTTGSTGEPGTLEESKARPRPGEKKGFVEEMRIVAMKLHTREQAPKEGQAEMPKERPKFAPTRDGYLAFLSESKEVYDTMETIMANADAESAFARFQGTGLERGDVLARDIDAMMSKYDLAKYEPSEDGPGRTYAKLLRELAEKDPPAFICHYYNVYFAHTAGGRMIGKMVSDKCLEGETLAFYQYPAADGGEQTDEEEKERMKELLGDVKATIDDVATGWTRDEKDHCLEETSKSFEYSGKLLKCIMTTSS